eukprot:6186597-Pleurochrysis_carterae.AAC.3
MSLIRPRLSCDRRDCSWQAVHVREALLRQNACRPPHRNLRRARGAQEYIERFGRCTRSQTQPHSHTATHTQRHKDTRKVLRNKREHTHTHTSKCTQT